jgi:DNA-binding beta-propeller fold protein YncE
MQKQCKIASIFLLHIFLLSLIFNPLNGAFTKIFGQSRIAHIDKLYQSNIELGSYGTGNGQFESPAGIAIDSANNVYVVDAGNNRIQIFYQFHY